MNKSGSPAVSSAAFVNIADQILQMNRMITLFHFEYLDLKQGFENRFVETDNPKILKNLNFFSQNSTKINRFLSKEMFNSFDQESKKRN